MATQIEELQQMIADPEASNGKDAPFAKLLRQQLVGMELNLHNKNERFLLATGSPEPETSYDQQGEPVETEEDAIRAEALRRLRVRRLLPWQPDQT